MMKSFWNGGKRSYPQANPHFREAVTIEQYKSSAITDYLKEYGGKLGNKTILAAFKNPDDFVKPEKV